MAHQDVTDRVRRLYANNAGLNIRHMNMAEGYFLLRKTHPNYDTLASVAIIAAVNRQPLRIRTEDTTTDVQYLVMEWN
ncbi:MAG TPA: hypothetical protein VN844_10365 [Pyrinomonadaceae bacterium]|nr:hypothetical protein [Pyrinomonadaceae bacterium]